MTLSGSTSSPETHSTTWTRTRRALARNVPLRRKIALRSVTPIRPVSEKRKEENRERQRVVRQVRPVWCEARIPGCYGRTLDTHEILTRARLGSIVDSANWLHLCRFCHSIITANPDWSNRHGWTIPSWATEEDERCAWLARLHYDFCTTECAEDHVQRWRESPYNVGKAHA